MPEQSNKARRTSDSLAEYEKTPSIIFGCRGSKKTPRVRSIYCTYTSTCVHKMKPTCGYFCVHNYQTIMHFVVELLLATACPIYNYIHCIIRDYTVTSSPLHDLNESNTSYVGDADLEREIQQMHREHLYETRALTKALPWLKLGVIATSESQ